MYASKTPMERLIDYSATNLKFDGAEALRRRIVAFIKGVRGERKNPVTEKQIVAWFRGTPPAFVKAQLTEVCGGEVRIAIASMSSNRRASGVYVYEVAP
jgi:hypothetical protein